MKKFEQLNWNRSYQQLADELYSAHKPEWLNNGRLAHVNFEVAKLLEIDPSEFKRDDIVELVMGLSEKIDLNPVAMCYSGHQFGHFAGRLGDGRALLLGEILTDAHGKFDCHLKGAGKTLYSRQGDGKAVLRSTIREYLCGEAMFHLGIASTRALCMTISDEPVFREKIETGATLLRVAPSHIRFGHFEYAYYANKHEYLSQIADYVLQHHYPEQSQDQQGYLFLLQEAIKKTALMIAQWQGVGFMHGVMNTDNMSILGLTMDYGPYGFMDAFESGFICNHSDHEGRYSYKNQPEVGLFNVSCLAQTFLPLLADDVDDAVVIAKAEIEKYQSLYEAYFAEVMQQKLGFKTSLPSDMDFSDRLFDLMELHRVDFTRFFRALSAPVNAENMSLVRSMFADDAKVDAWFNEFYQRIDEEGMDVNQRSQQMKATNPKYVLRNYLAEQAIRKAEDEGDFSELDRLMKLLSAPFDEQPEYQHYADEPPEWSEHLSISCSS